MRSGKQYKLVLDFSPTRNPGTLSLSWNAWQLLGLSKSAKFSSGLDHFAVVTDHNPLVPILNTHRLDEIENPRLQCLRTRLMSYNFTAQWLKGTQNEAADALSRYPHRLPSVGDDIAEYDTDGNCTPTLAPSITQIRASLSDPSDTEAYTSMNLGDTLPKTKSTKR